MKCLCYEQFLGIILGSSELTIINTGYFKILWELTNEIWNSDFCQVLIRDNPILSLFYRGVICKLYCIPLQSTLKKGNTICMYGVVSKSSLASGPVFQPILSSIINIRYYNSLCSCSLLLLAECPNSSQSSDAWNFEDL